MIEVLTHVQSEEQFRSSVEQLVADPTRRQQLVELLHEDHSIYDQRGTASVTSMRGWLLLALARISLPDAALPFVLEELDTGDDAYLVAAAANALRTYPEKRASFAGFVVRAIANIRYQDEPLSFESFGGYAVGSAHTTPLRELLATLVWLGPHANAVVPEVESLRNGPTALGKKLQPVVDQVLAAIRAREGNSEAAECCQLPDSVRSLFSPLRTTRTNTGPIESTEFEDQDGASITFGEFFHGRPSIVVFFYTRCDNPLKCSLTITKLARIQQLLKAEGAIDQINTAGITYDPGFDLRERIRNYGEHRGVDFSARHRLLRTADGLGSLRKHFKLGVNFVESLVNRHRIEVYILDAQGRIAASFERIQWSENDVVTQALEVLRETQNTNPSKVPFAPRRHRLASPVLGTAVALGLALFPKCPLCWAAYLSLFGIAGVETIPYSPWLQPVLAIFLLFNLTSVWFRSRATGRMVPFYLVSLGAVALITSKAFADLEALGITGVIFTLAGSVWSTLAATNRSQLARQ